MKKTFKHTNFTCTFTDENGYFSLTGECDGSSGACGDCIAASYPEFKLLNDVHLCDCKTGKPMHAWANAEYWINEKKFDTLLSHLGCSMELATSYQNAMAAYFQALSDEKDISGYHDRVTVPMGEKLADIQTEIEDFWQERAQEAYDLAEETETNLVGAFIHPYDADGNCISDEYKNHLDSLTDPDKAIAAAMQEDIDVLEVEESGYSDEIYIAAGREYRVLTDDEADTAWDESLDSYLDDCVIPELPKNMQNYFDNDAWKRDAKMDGRGHSLSSYDGNEYYQTPDNSETYYLYRQ